MRAQILIIVKKRMDSAGHFLFAEYSTYWVVGIFDLLSAKKNRDHGIGHNCLLFVLIRITVDPLYNGHLLAILRL